MESILFNPLMCYSAATDIVFQSSPLSVKQSEMVYDYLWYPGMSSTYPETCCFASTSRDNPIHLWDSLTGCLRCSYLAYDQMVLSYIC